MLNILINAYACSPSWGSEPGMAWNWISNLAKHCELYIITEGEWRKEIEEAVKVHPYGMNMHFYFNPVSDKVRQMCWNQGDWRFYYYYRQWQKKTLKIAKQICKDHKIDVIHQLNMVGFREPGLLWKIEGPKYVWGPIGGMENIPTAYLKDAGFKQNVFCRIKNAINTLQYTYQTNVYKAIKRSDALVAAVKGVKDVLEKVYYRESVLINETGCHIDADCPTRKRVDGKHKLDLIWVGKFDFRKKLDMALRSIAEVKNLDICLHICGTGSEEQVAMYKQLATDLHIEDKCVWHGKVEHSKIQQMMADSDVFFFTSIMEATSTVTLEAISSCLPVLCFDTCGFGPLITEKIGRKVPISNPDQSVRDFAEQIRFLYANRELLNEMSKNEMSYRESLSWESKAKQIVDIYNKVLSEQTY
ncbi:MAG: glycosyltransferase [Bacteroidales bacterium]|nr:glycosyltransferase [Bacteroidales bacterium]